MSGGHECGLDRTYCEDCGVELEVGQVGLCEDCASDDDDEGDASAEGGAS